jgi:hypothetical protein
VAAAAGTAQMQIDRQHDVFAVAGPQLPHGLLHQSSSASSLLKRTCRILLEARQVQSYSRQQRAK